MGDSLGGILTKGLGADASAMILGKFRLKLISVEVIEVPVIGGSGSRPYAPGEIKDFYKPVKDLHPYTIPKSPQKHIAIRITFRTSNLAGREYSKDFLVSEKSANTTLKVLNVANKTKEHISALFTKIGKTPAKLTVTFTKTMAKIKVFVVDFKKRNNTEDHK